MNNTIGKVILAGAGPGDPDLVTVKDCQLFAAGRCCID
jgi:siroheme synthase